MKKLDKRMFKKSSEELQEYMKFKRRGSRIENRKGKGSYTRKQKHKKDENQDMLKYAWIVQLVEYRSPTPRIRVQIPQGRQGIKCLHLFCSRCE